MIINAHFTLRVVLVNIVLELLETELVPVLEIPVVFRMFLHCIIRQMDESVVDIL